GGLGLPDPQAARVRARMESRTAGLRTAGLLRRLDTGASYRPGCASTSPAAGHSRAVRRGGFRVGFRGVVRSWLRQLDQRLIELEDEPIQLGVEAAQDHATD